jgi:hypothetical protein
MAHRRVADERGRVGDEAALFLEKVVALHVAVAGHGADGDMVALVAHVLQVLDAPEVDEDRRRREAELHDREQRVTARQELRLIAVLA